MADWAQLLPDLLISIAKRINSYEDFVAFRGACRSWRSVAVKDNFNPSYSVQIPWLMLAQEEEEEEEEGGNSNLRGFMSLTKGGMVQKVDLPEARGKHCIESKGWLITADVKAEIELLHPLTRVRIPLPHPRTFKYYFEEEGQDDHHSLLILDRAVLSASPSLTKDYVVVVIMMNGPHLAFWRPGNDKWSTIEPRLSAYEDVVYYMDQFYTINTVGNLVICHVQGPRSGTVEIVGQVSPYGADEGHAYLVESSGDLLVVKRNYEFPEPDYDGYLTKSFTVYKFDSANFNKWQEITDLGGRSVFVGHSAAISVAASAAGGGGIKPNCVYFSDDFWLKYAHATEILGGRDVGIYNLGSGTVETLPKANMRFSNYCPPIWVSPSF